MMMLRRKLILKELQLVVRKSVAHGGLIRGLHAGAKVIEKHVAQLCVLAEDCNQPDYVKFVKALCTDHGGTLLTVPWAGVCMCVKSWLASFIK